MLMKRLRSRLVLVLSLCLAWLTCLPASSHLAPQTAVNAVIGDISYYERFSRLPTGKLDESLRIRTHLSYVEKLLRARVPSTVAPGLLPRRRQMLDLLQTYHQQGVFPSQSAYQGRRPHFIDEQGRLCAVGYLIAQTAGLSLAREISQLYPYAYLPDMKMPELDAWVAGSGLTLQELAMIQPAYHDIGKSDAAELAYGLPLITLMAVQALALVFHISILAGDHPDWYQDLQAYDAISTLAALGLMMMLSMAAPLVSDLESEDKLLFPMAGGFITLAFGIPNVLMLHLLGERTHAEKNQLNLGWFQTPDRQTTWGFHASLSF